MTLLGFSPVMAPKVENFLKLQTIREFRKDGRDPKEGDRLQLYVGLRRPGARKLVEPDPVCTVAGAIDIEDRRKETRRGAAINSIMLSWPRDSECVTVLMLCDARDLDDFARADGFSNFDGMLQWFCPKGGRFSGTLTAWLPPIEALRRAA